MCPIQRTGSSHQPMVLVSSSHLPHLAAFQGSSPWPQQALSCSGLRRLGGSYPTWQSVFALLSTNKMKPPSGSKRVTGVCLGLFPGCLLTLAWCMRSEKAPSALSSEAWLMDINLWSPNQVCNKKGGGDLHTAQCMGRVACSCCCLYTPCSAVTWDCLSWMCWDGLENSTDLLSNTGGGFGRAAIGSACIEFMGSDFQDSKSKAILSSLPGAAFAKEEGDKASVSLEVK